ncbi:MAG: hypothetical protein FJ090_04100 [Deltaproteobacteria bacterium]|nr:hypothetical protein [Deltaproteobacteria bacterium]
MKTRIATLRDGLTHNLGYRLVALVMTLVFWVWVQSEQRVETRARATVKWLLPEGLTLVEPPLESATLTVEGVQAIVRSLRQRELEIEVDLSKAREGDVAVDLAQKSIDGLPQQLHVVEVSPSQVRVTLDRVLRRKVSVSPNPVGKVADGYRVIEVSVSPQRGDLEGPVSILKNIDSVTTEEVDIGSLREDADFTVGLALRKGVALAGKGHAFTVHVDVEPIVTERRFEGVPVLVRDGAYVASTQSVAVQLAGPEEELAGIDAGVVSVMVYLPDGYGEAAGEARHGKGNGPRYEVVHGGSEAVKVQGTEPDRIAIVRKE